MRTEQQWLDTVYPKLVEQLPPRIQKDIMKYPKPDPIPDPGSYYIYGPVASGKTILAAHLWLDACHAMYMNAEPMKAIFMSATEFMFEVRSTYNVNSSRSEEDVLLKYKSIPFLVLDDLGAERTTDWALTTFYLLINHRYEHILPTVFTSNLSLEELDDKMDDSRIPSRIMRMCEVLKTNLKNK